MSNIKDFKKQLDELVQSHNQVFIVPHIGADFDAIASSIAMCLIAKKYNIPAYIIVNEDSYKIEAGVKKIIDEIKNNDELKNYINIINLDKYHQLSSDNDLLIATDVNKNYLICCKDDLSNFRNIVIIDHHNEDEHTIKTEYKYIDTSSSSASEIIVELLTLFQIKYDKAIANYLLAGIYLDSNKLTKNITSKSMKIVSKLLEKGATIDKVTEFFEEDFASDRRVQELVSKANFFTYTIATCLADETENYTKEELAKVADYLLKYKVDAAFAIGCVDEKAVSISARSKGRIDVSLIMKELQGGGNIYSAATRIENEELPEVSKKLQRVIKPSFNRE